MCFQSCTIPARAALCCTRTWASSNDPTSLDVTDCHRSVTIRLQARYFWPLSRKTQLQFLLQSTVIGSCATSAPVLRHHGGLLPSIVDDRITLSGLIFHLGT